VSTTHLVSRRSTRVLLLGVSAAVAIATAACGSSSSGSGGGSSSSSTPATGGSTASAGTSSQFAADIAKYSGPETTYPTIPTISGGVKSLAGKTVWYIPIGDAVPILATFGTGLQQGLAAAGLKYHLCDGKFLPTNIASCLQQAQTQGADAVVTGYIDYALASSAFQTLASHHIPVLIAGEDPDGGVTASTASLAFDSGDPALDQLQKLQMESVISDSGGKAKIIYLGVTDSPSTKAGAAYGKQFVQDNCPGCTIDEVDYNTAEISKVPSQVSSALTAHPDTTYVIDELDAAGQGTYAGIQTAGFTNKVKMSGSNGGLDSLQRIKAGTVQTIDIGLSPIYTGWQYADAILRQMTGSVPTEGIGPERVFTSANVGNLTLTPDAYATNAWYGDDSFTSTFTTAWGVS
jgi:ABC-type sugar transport system substrate-binding protein